MNTIDFETQISKIYAENGFCKNKHHFYKEINNDVIVVYGVHKSNYGNYCYIEFGLCIKSINKYMPFPKFNQLNVNLGRIMFEKGKAIMLNKLEDIDFEDIFIKIKKSIDETLYLVSLEKKQLIEELKSNFHESWYVLGDETVNYFGLPKENFQYHYVEE